MKKYKDQVCLIKRRTAVAILVRSSKGNKYYVTSGKYIRYMLRGRIPFLYCERLKKNNINRNIKRSKSNKKIYSYKKNIK